MSLQAVINSGVKVAAGIAMEDRVTFQRPTSTTDSAGGHTKSFENTNAVNIPVVIDIASANQRATLGEKIIKGTLYALYVPSQYGSVVVDLDTQCNAVVAARGVDAERVFHVQGVNRIAGALIEVLASREE